MARHEVRPARIEDLVGAAWRDGDVPVAPELLERTLVTSHEVWAGFIGGELACVYGIEMPSVCLPAHLWVVTTEVVERHWVTFLRQSRLMIDRSATRFGPLETWCRSGYQKSDRWLRWLGFRKIDEIDVRGLKMLRYKK